MTPDLLAGTADATARKACAVEKKYVDVIQDSVTSGKMHLNFVKSEHLLYVIIMISSTILIVIMMVIVIIIITNVTKNQREDYLGVPVNRSVELKRYRRCLTLAQ